MFGSGGGRSMPGRSKTLGPGFMKSGSIGSFFWQSYNLQFETPGLPRLPRLRDSRDSQDSGTPKTPGLPRLPRLPEDRWKK